VEFRVQWTPPFSVRCEDNIMLSKRATSGAAPIWKLRHVLTLLVRDGAAHLAAAFFASGIQNALADIFSGLSPSISAILCLL
jgi:hypothetical protein